MWKTILLYGLFILTGYLLGSILFARVFGRIFAKKDIVSESRDQNPGTANAFMYGGAACGVLTLIGDIGKGFLPVFLCMRLVYDAVPSELGLSLVLLAPVLGHILPVYYHFRGGKGIATTFGVLLGFAPNFGPALILAVIFILFSLVIRITPHFYRTMATYILAAAFLFVWGDGLGIKFGFLLISVLVCLRLHFSKEEREELKVRLLWTH